MWVTVSVLLEEKNECFVTISKNTIIHTVIPIKGWIFNYKIFNQGWIFRGGENSLWHLSFYGVEEAGRIIEAGYQWSR